MKLSTLERVKHPNRELVHTTDAIDGYTQNFEEGETIGFLPIGFHNEDYAVELTREEVLNQLQKRKADLLQNLHELGVEYDLA